ncbi:MAG: radical SAM protein [Verrucomicrobiae bacterium]|nr:radical SAM protein [Verrucomicrobiae bacterium]
MNTLTEMLASCRVCPHHCKVNRLRDEIGRCGIGRLARVASYGPHHGEEDCLRGWRGSGTIFFSGCNLQCVFCQNWDISHEAGGEAVSAERLAEIMLELQELGCHNINWVTPSHVVPQCIEALTIAKQRGLRLPVVYNSGGYDSVETLQRLEGLVDIYMPDFKFWDVSVAARFTNAADYPEVARAALREMHRQVGVLQIDHNGLARRGLLVRHLVMPNNLAGTAEIARWLATELSPDTYCNVMAQYHPAGDAFRHPELRRRITASEFSEAVQAALRAGLHRLDKL